MKQYIPVVLWTLKRLRPQLFLLVALPTLALGQLRVTLPVPRIIFQRSNANRAGVPFRALLTSNVTQVKIRMVVRQGGTTTDWTMLTPAGDSVAGIIPSVVGGWYDLEAEAFTGSTSLGTVRIPRVGVGEVLLAAGQSNAQGFPYSTGAVDDRVSCMNYYDGQITEYRFPLAFSQLSSSVMVGPTNNNYIYGMLGDKLVQRLGVPVLIYGAALGGTSSMQWQQSAQGVVDIAESVQWDGADDLRPYRAIKSTLNHYVRRTGLRGIFWHQGESDNGKSASDYVTNLQYLIQKSRNDAGLSTLPWVIARASWVNSSPDGNIVNAQNQVIAQTANCYAGPNTDNYGNNYRQDGTHFLQSFYPQFAELWNQSLTDAFFQQSTPLTVSAVPARITVGVPQPVYQYQGGHSVLSFLDETMTGSSQTVYTARLISGSGQFVANLGVSRERPMRVFLPDNLAAGSYQVQIISSSSGSTLSPPFTVFAPSFAKKTGTGLLGQYYSSSDGNGPLAYKSVDAPLDFTWFDTPPVPYMPVRDYIISWTGQVEAPVTGTYTFKAMYDDGVKVWVNGQQIINDFNAHPYPVPSRGQIYLQANQRYDVRVDLLQYWYNAQIRLLWAIPSVTNQAVYIPRDRLFPATTSDQPSVNLMKVAFPTPRTVIQRDANNTALVNITGTCPTQTERVEIRVSPTSTNYGQNSDFFVTLDAQPGNGVFSGSISLTGGWYNLDIRSVAQSKVISHTRVTPVGVGEVFVVAGEANAQGVTPLRSVAPATDDRVSTVPHTNYSDTTRLPMPPRFRSLAADGTIGPRGNTAWFWSELGDMLTTKLNVPVLFYNASLAGTTVRNWRQSMEQGSTNDLNGNPFPAGMPYSNLKRVLKDYVSLTGLRAVIWQQGESEYYSSDPQATNYANDLRAVIARSRTDAGLAQLPWLIARTSADNTTRQLYASGSYEPVTNRQNEVLQSVAQTIAGPITDTIQMPRPGGSTQTGVNFQGNGLTRLASAWNSVLTNSLWNMTPVMSQSATVTDLRLSAAAGARVSTSGADLPFTLTVQNEGVRDASNVLVRCTLPPQLQFTGSSSLSLVQGTLLGIVPSLVSGQQQSLSFTARPQQGGTYRIGAEIVRTDQLDIDSRPGTSFGDGEDDSSWLDFRTLDNAASPFTASVSPNAPVLPPVQTNQPLPDPNKIDLSLSMMLSAQEIASSTPLSVSLVVRNDGGIMAQNVTIGCKLPGGIGFIGSSSSPAMSSPDGNRITRATIGSIPPGGQVVLVFSAQAIGSGTQVLLAQIEAATGTDVDSTPGTTYPNVTVNGAINGEDDEAVAGIRSLVTP